VLLAGGATLGLLALIPLVGWLKAPAALWVGGTMIDACRRAAIREFHIDGDHIELMTEGGCVHGELRSGSFVAPFLTIIRWRPPGARFDRTLLILPDMIDPDSFRRLRVLLRWAKPGTDHTSRGAEQH
jgi:toxin CptA